MSGLRVAYERDIEILRGVDLSASRGKITAVIGPNGAGKSTLLRAVAGLAPVVGGRVELDGRAVTGVSTAAMVRLGVAFVPQERSVFSEMTIRENLLLGGWSRRSERVWLAERIAAVCDQFPVLGVRLDEPAGNLSGGQQKALEIARGLVSDPTVLLLDEPTAGLSPRLAQEVYEQVAALGDRLGVTVLLVDQNVREALAIAQHVYVLAMGRNDAEGAPADVLGRLDDIVRGWMQQQASGLGSE
ncbi:MAG: ABC transporter ATP-binding protein [Thermoleophilia bacterium]|nr:ABC transporter ATP-binding protein [Thermoleophilia bacterium]